MSIEIRELSIQGDGISQGPIYVPFTLPGEIIEGEVTGNRIEKPRILTPSSDRVKAPCSHFKSCGGCSMQHASDVFLANWKRSVVEKALAGQGLSADFRETIISPAQSRRRATFTATRTKKGVMIGFHGRASDSLIPIPNCKLLHPDIMAGMEVLEELTKIAASRKSHISLAVTQSVNGLDIMVSDAKEVDAAMLEQLGKLTEAHGLSRLVWNGEVVALRSSPVQKFGQTKVVPPPGAFLQATEAGQIVLTKAVQQIAAEAKNIIDLFAGCGTFTLPLAKKAQVLAVEGDNELLIALDAGWREGQELRMVKTLKRDLFRTPLQPDELKSFDVAIIDPPRAGAKAQCEELALSTIPRIAFISCNPVTFARDAKILTEAGYHIDWVQVVDQFRWSAHVELVAQFSRS